MSAPRKTQSASVSNDANDLSILFASFWPQDADEVRLFLTDAAFALGLREAELARSLGVSRATFSGWKARGVIPAAHAKWFSTDFAVAVLRGGNGDLHADFLHAGMPAVLHLFQATDFDPFGLGEDNAADAISVCHRHFGGLCRLALFLQNRIAIKPPIEEFEVRTARLLGQVARAAAPMLWFRNVSQSVSQ